MKKRIYFVFRTVLMSVFFAFTALSASLCLSLSMPLFVQGQTSMEEYKYITKGYKKQISDGLDPTKKGYVFEEIETMEYEDEGKMCGIVFSKMIHEEDGLKAIIMHFYEDEELATFCIPHPDTKDSVWLPAIQNFNSFWVDRDNFPYFSSAFMKMLYFYETEKE